MDIGIDIRGISPQWQGGVNEYSVALLNELLTYPDIRAHLVGSLYRSTNKHHLETLFPHSNVVLSGSFLPSKLLNTSLLAFKFPKLDSFFGKEPDVFWMPNINISALHARLPRVVTFHDLSFELYPEFFSRKIRAWHNTVRPKRHARDATHILTVSQSTKQDLIDLYQIPQDRISVTYPGLSEMFFFPQIDISSIQTRYNLPEKFILYLGTIEPRKNLRSVIQSFEHLAHDYPDLHLVLAGKNGWLYEDIHAHARHSPVSNRIHFTGFIAHEDKPSLYAAASIFVYPSFYEGFGFPPLEAMATGTPVITANLSSFPETIGNAGLMVSPYNAYELSWAMRELYTDPELYARLRNQGPYQAQQFTWKRTAQATHSIFTQIANR